MSTSQVAGVWEEGSLRPAWWVGFQNCCGACKPTGAGGGGAVKGASGEDSSWLGGCSLEEL